jgi:hypothetical protein
MHHILILYYYRANDFKANGDFAKRDLATYMRMTLSHVWRIIYRLPQLPSDPLSLAGYEGIITLSYKIGLCYLTASLSSCTTIHSMRIINQKDKKKHFQIRRLIWIGGWFDK